MLTANNSLTVDEIALNLGITSRSVYRYIDTFREAGFVIKKNDSYIKPDKSSSHFKEITDLLHFSNVEIYILKSAIESIDENNLIKQNLKTKLYMVYNYNVLAETIVIEKTGIMFNGWLKPWKISSRSFCAITLRPTATTSATDTWRHTNLLLTMCRCGATVPKKKRTNFSKLPE